MNFAEIESGKVKNVIVADSADVFGPDRHLVPGVDEAGHVAIIGDEWDGTHFHTPEVAAVPELRHITVLAMRNRFTQAEKIMIDLASIDDPAKTMAERQQSAAIRVLQADLAASSYIDLDRPDTRDGVLQLETANILQEGRALEILDAPVDPSERPAK